MDVGRVRKVSEGGKSTSTFFSANRLYLHIFGV